MIRLLGSASAATLLCLASGAQAQEADGATLEEVIVTAQKVESNIQTTPMAVSALSGDALQKRVITDVGAVMSTLPNVDMGMNLGNPRLAIRGIGFDNVNVGGEARVAFHQDGVYLSRPGSIQAGFYDVERIEVLRGPQGTLYGRNATSGAVNLITRGPTDSFQGYFTARAGNYRTLDLEGAVGGPITDKISGRLAFRTENRDGYGRDTTTGTDVDDKQTAAIRGKLRFELTDNFTVGVTGDVMHEDDHAYQYVFMRANPDTNLAVPGAVTPRPVSGTLFGGTVPTKPRNTTGDVAPQNARDYYGITTNLNLDLGAVQWVSILSYRRSELQTITDLDQTSAPLSFIRQREISDQYSVETRFQGSFDRGSWLIGAFGFKEKLHGGTRTPFNPAVIPTFSPINPLVACAGGPCSAARLAPSFTTGVLQTGYIDTDAYAVFGNVHFKITEQIGIRAGARYGREKKAIKEFTITDFVTRFPPYAPDPAKIGTRPTQQTSRTYKNFTPSLTLDYQPTDSIYAYATWAKGVKSGGFNLGVSQPPFNPEKITDYEIGLKADWLERRLRTNIALFKYNYKDVQLSKVQGIPPAVVTFNAPGASLKGAELELIYLPTDQVRLELNYGYLDTEYKVLDTIDSARPWLGVLNLAGNQMTQAPKHTINLAGEYTWPTALGDLTLRAETQYKSKIFFTAFNLDYVSQDSNWISNAFLRLEPENSNWRGSIYVRNLTNELTAATITVGPTFWGSPIYGAYTPPRTYGVELNYSF